MNDDTNGPDPAALSLPDGLTGPGGVSLRALKQQWRTLVSKFQLTDKQADFLWLSLLDTRETLIAEVLKISPAGVHARKRTVIAKFGVHSMQEVFIVLLATCAEQASRTDFDSISAVAPGLADVNMPIQVRT
jgi:DNA-binding CsgD family transcriptional regulator